MLDHEISKWLRRSWGWTGGAYLRGGNPGYNRHFLNIEEFARTVAAKHLFGNFGSKTRVFGAKIDEKARKAR